MWIPKEYVRTTLPEPQYGSWDVGRDEIGFGRVGRLGKKVICRCERKKKESVWEHCCQRWWPDESADEPLPADDSLAAFAVEAARQQAAQRGEGDDAVDEAFIARALATSQRMRQEALKSQQKRAANLAAVAAQHGDIGLVTMQQAMQEHAAEVLTPNQIAATGLDGETGAEQQLETDGDTGAQLE